MVKTNFVALGAVLLHVLILIKSRNANSEFIKFCFILTLIHAIAFLMLTLSAVIFYYKGRKSWRNAIFLALISAVLGWQTWLLTESMASV
jgi:hypothetical protein